MKESRSLNRLSTQQNSDLNKDSKSITSTVSTPSTPLRSGQNTTQVNSSAVSNAVHSRRQTTKVHSTASISWFNVRAISSVASPISRFGHSREPVASNQKKCLELLARYYVLKRQHVLAAQILASIPE